MEALGLLGDGFATALQPLNLLVVFLGVLIGTIIGMLPGIGPINAIAILIPISFALGLPATAMLILFRRHLLRRAVRQLDQHDPPRRSWNGLLGGRWRCVGAGPPGRAS
jgi:hypothetical protein